MFSFTRIEYTDPILNKVSNWMFDNEYQSEFLDFLMTLLNHDTFKAFIKY